MKVRFWLAAALTVSVLFTGSTARADAVGTLVNNLVNELEDEDHEAVLNSAGTAIKPNGAGVPGPIVETNDLIAGVIKIQKAGIAGGSDVDLQSASDTFTAVFLIKVGTRIGATAAPSTSITTINFLPATQADWTTVFGAGGLLALAGGAPTIATGTMAIVFDGVSFSTADPTLGTLSASASTYVAGARKLWEFGFTGGAGAAGAHEFWNTFGIDSEFTHLIPTFNPTNRLALGVTAYHSGPLLLLHNFLGTGGPLIPGVQSSGADAFFTGETFLQGKGDFQSSAGVWPIGTDTNLYIKPTPEPGTLVLFGIGGAGLAAMRRRRKKAQKAQAA